MVWIECHTDIWEHHKTLRMVSILNKPIYAVVGHLISLWHFTLRNAPETGNLKPWGDQAIETAARWDGNAGDFVRALREVVYLDESTIHAWEKFTIHYKVMLERRNRQKDQIRKRVKRFREKRVPKNKQVGNDIGNAGVTPSNAPTIPYLTIPNQTIPNLKKDIVPAPGKPLTDVQKIVLTFKMTSGYERDDKAWDKLNFSRCSKTAGALLEFFGNWRDAAHCIEDTYENLTKKGLTVTIETVVKHAAEYKKNIQEREAKHGVLSLPSDGSLPTNR